MKRDHYDVIVIGGGVMGLSAAWQAAPSARVALVERFEIGHRWGASHGGERIFRHLYPDPKYTELALAAESGWRQLERYAGRLLIHRAGCIEHGEVEDLEALVSVAEAQRVPIQQISARKARSRWPGFRFVTDVLVQPTAGWLRAADAIRTIAQLAAARGVELIFESPVLDVKVLGESVEVHTADRHIVSPTAIVAAGAWTTTLLPDLVLPSLITTEEHVFFFEARNRDAAPSIPSFLHVLDHERYGLQAADGLVKLGEHQTGEVVTGDDRSFVTDPVRITRIERYVAEWIPHLTPRVRRSATCLYTGTPNAGFILDRVGPVVVGAGFSGHGFKFAPAIGRHLADLATGAANTLEGFTIADHLSDHRRRYRLG